MFMTLGKIQLTLDRRQDGHLNAHLTVASSLRQSPPTSFMQPTTIHCLAGQLIGRGASMAVER